MFENLSERLERSFKLLKGEGKITEINVAETLKDVRRALLDADVNYKVAKSFTDTVDGQNRTRRTGDLDGRNGYRFEPERKPGSYFDVRSARFR